MRPLAVKFLPLAMAAAFVSPFALAAPASAAPAHYPCGGTPPDLDPAQGTGKANGVNMRTGSSTSCASRGLAHHQLPLLHGRPGRSHVELRAQPQHRFRGVDA